MRAPWRLWSIAVATVVLLSVALSHPVRAASVAVTTANDSGPGSLRQAILDANADPGPDTITFAISGSGTRTIGLLSSLPAVLDPLTIDGWSQPGFTGAPLIELDGSLAGANVNGLDLFGGSTVRGLIINRLSGSAIFVHPGSGANVIAGNFIGTSASGSAASPNGGFGVLVIDSANNVIGGVGTRDRNVISGNSHGIYITGAPSTGNVVQGNFIGTDAAGRAPIGNVPFHGVTIDGASNNLVGGLTPASRNIISGNGFFGVSIARGFFSGLPASGNLVQGNYIGTDVTGTVALENHGQAVAIIDTPGNTVGGTTSAARNVISGNTHNDGVFIWKSRSSGNLVQGNYVGTDVTGSVALGNATGVSLNDAPNNLVGGTTPGSRNVIAGNGFAGAFNANAGVAIVGSNATGNVVQGNYIGTDASGRYALGNLTGIRVAASNNLIGGTVAGATNVIAFNRTIGIGVDSVSPSVPAVNDAILGNSIFANGQLGIDLAPSRSPGVTPNDLGDADIGPNTLQNFPVLGTATHKSVRGQLNSLPNATYRIELFSNAVCDPTGFGEGEEYLGARAITTDPSGNSTFRFRTDVDAGRFLTATATDAAGNTSEFSGCVVVRGSDDSSEAGGLEQRGTDETFEEALRPDPY